MALHKLAIRPDQDNYAVTEGLGARSVRLGGGASRYRRDYINDPGTVECQWTLTQDEYEYMMTFYRATKNGSEPFLIDLIYRDSILTEHTAHFKEGTFRLTGVKAFSFIIKATLEVIPTPPDDDLDNGLVISYEAFAEFAAFSYDLLETIVNVTMPENFGR